MSERSSYCADAADRLYRWLAARPETTIPRLSVVGRSIAGDLDAYAVHCMLGRLRADGRITWRSGARSKNRGHQAIMIVAQRRVLKTEGCPFDAPAFVGELGP